jgi:hypothetical protein
MEQKTKNILIGAGVLALAYHLYNSSKGGFTSFSGTPNKRKKAKAAKLKAAADKIAAVKAASALAEKVKIDAKAKIAAEEAAREKAMNEFMYPPCPDGHGPG